MKTLILFLTCALAQNLSFAQCDKKLLLKFNQVSEVDGLSSNLIKVEGSINFTKEKILINALFTGGEQVIESIIQSVSECKWNGFLRNGKAVYKLLSSKGIGEPKDEATLILEGVEGKLKVTFRPPGTELQFPISEFKIVE